jgi:hypothetical protein
MRLDPADLNQNTTYSISSLSESLAEDEVQTILSETTKCPRKLETKITRIRLSSWEATEVLLGLAGFLGVLYLFGVAAFGLALIYYTFAQ